MDKNWLLTNLKLARSQLDNLITEIEAEQDSELVDVVTFVLINSVYTHLNYAWNTRLIGADKIEGTSYDEAIKFPKDFDL